VDEALKRIEKDVVLIAPICFSHEDIKDSNEDDLLFDDQDYRGSQGLSCRGVPVESDECVPLMLLVPHERMQSFNMAVSLQNISNLLMSLAVVAYEEKEDMRKETRVTIEKENKTHRQKLINEQNETSNSSQASHTNLLATNSPKKSTFWEGAFKMTFTTISPKNQYKKLAVLAKGKPLTQETCHWMRAFNNVKKHKML